ncbi:MAG: MmgE/PrpD family protein [Gaiellaceae bacterium]
MTDLATAFSAFASELTADALPPAAVSAVHNDLLDTVGCALAGSQAPGIPELLGVLERWGGRLESSVWARELELPAPEAAFANGAAAHALDYDDTHDGAVLHAGVTVIPAALAAAQLRAGTTGADLVAAIAAGIETVCRLGASIEDGPSSSGWLLTPVCGAFGAVAAAARALALDAETTHHALGIAYAQAAGNGQATLDSALTKRLQAGFAARAGVTAAVLAAAGITGAHAVFEGERGWFRVYHGSRYDRDIALDGLGRSFLLEQLTFKPYPCCRWMHAAIEAALELRERGIDAAAVQRLEVAVSRQALASTGRRPSALDGAKRIVEAQFSIPYAVAVALLDGKPALAHFTHDAVMRPDLNELAAIVHPVLDPDPERLNRRGISSAVLTAQLRGGGEAQVLVERPAPAAEASLVEKFLDCCAFAGIDRDDAGALARRLLSAADEPDADELGRSVSRVRLREREGVA